MKPINKTLKTKEKFQNLTDEELVVEIVRTKNSLLFGMLYDRFYQVVYYKCYSFSKSVEEAQDLTQDVFLKLFIKLGSFQGRSKFSTWLYAFTYNYCVNYVKRDTAKQIEKHAVSQNESNYLPIEEIDDSELFQLKADKLDKALDIIGPEEKMMLLLKYQDDLSIKEICTLMSLGESNVKMRLKRAKAKIVKIYREEL